MIRRTHLRVDFLIREVSDDGSVADDDLRHARFVDDIPITTVRDFFDRCGRAMGAMFCSSSDVVAVLTRAVASHNKVPVIKVLRELGRYGLKEAKDLVEVPPGTALVIIEDDGSQQDAARRLTDAGADVGLVDGTELDICTGVHRPVLATYKVPV